jgi:nucleosome binding factor SPN SPT16 subunit
MKKLQILMSALIALFTFLTAKAQDNTAKNDVLPAYYEIKNTLVNDDATTAVTRAKAMLNVLDDNKKIMGQYAEKLLTDTRKIAGESNIDKQRKSFATLSQTMFEAVKVLKLNTANVYRQYCPMKKTYWLSDVAAIKNPYYGDQMLTCGSVKETLAP